MEKSTTVIIIDDHSIVRKGLKQLIENLGNYKVIDEYENGIAFLNEIHSLKKIPDVFILDYSMPMKNGIDILKEVTPNYPDYKFLLLTQNLEESIIDQAYNNDARGFLHKNCTAQQLKETIDNIVTLGYNNITEILRRIRSISTSNSKEETKEILSEKELSFLELVCHENEYTYYEMADILNISVKTIDKYRSNLFEKLNIKSKTGLVLYSFKHKLTAPFID